MKQDYLFKGASASASATSVSAFLGNNRGYAIQVEFSSITLTGTLSLQCRTSTALSFVAVEDSDVTIAAGEKTVWNVSGAEYSEVQVVWTRTGGAGTMDAVISIKQNIPDRG